MPIPDFSDEQQQRLRTLGLGTRQIHRLRGAITIARLFTRPTAPNNDVKEIVRDVAKLARKLSEKLWAMYTQIDAAHARAAAIVEEQFWNDPRMVDESGASVLHVLDDRLQPLEDAALAALGSIPTGVAARHKTASPQPIYRIKDALLMGWVEDQRAAGYLRESDGVLSPALPPYPRKFLLSKEEDSLFRNVCRIVYESAGAENTDPLRAIGECMKQEKRRRTDAGAALFAALQELERKQLAG